MKHYLKNSCMILLMVLFLFLLFKNPEISKASIANSMHLWINNLIPSLFPMIIINDILINYNFPLFLCSFFYKGLHKIFKFSFNGCYIFLMSLFIGTPANALLLKEMMDKKMIVEKEANKLLFVCYFSNPLFLYNMLSLNFSKEIVLKIIFIHYISNFIIAFLIRNTYVPKENNKMKIETKSLATIIPASCKKAINSMITILGVISFYMLLSSHITDNVVIKGILEMTTGLNQLVLKNYSYEIIIATIIINFSGLSIFTQIKSILEDTSLQFFNYFKGRILQVLIALLLLILV